MIHVRCAACDELLDEPGGLLFSPPLDADEVRQLNLCVRCHRAVDAWIMDQRAERRRIAELQYCTSRFSRCLDCDDHNRCSRYHEHLASQNKP